LAFGSWLLQPTAAAATVVVEGNKAKAAAAAAAHLDCLLGFFFVQTDIQQ
jgi:hypothetical protein